MWQYSRKRDGDKTYCRHHLHVHESKSKLPKASLDLNKAHLPTGWITIEEFLRFLIHELGAKTKCADWSNVLEKSEHTFYNDFILPEDFYTR